jgi:hypothetical protein
MGNLNKILKKIVGELIEILFFCPQQLGFGFYDVGCVVVLAT